MAYTEQQKNAFCRISKNNDEWYTPKYAVEPILEFLKPNSNILCPFDTDKSEFVKVLTEAGHNVKYSHINQNNNFLNLEKEEIESIDYIISNPPFSIKNDILKKLFELEKPFAMIFPLVSTLESNIRFQMFKDKKIQLLIFNKRINFINNNSLSLSLSLSLRIRNLHFQVFICVENFCQNKLFGKN